MNIRSDDSMPQLVRRVRETGVDGVLLGRAALGNPWIFRNKEWAKEASGLRSENLAVREIDQDAITQQERTRVMLEHSKHFEKLWGSGRFPAMRKHLAWYCKGFRGAVRWRTQMVRANSCSDVEAIVRQPPADSAVESVHPA